MLCQIILVYYYPILTKVTNNPVFVGVCPSKILFWTMTLHGQYTKKSGHLLKTRNLCQIKKSKNNFLFTIVPALSTYTYTRIL